MARVKTGSTRKRKHKKILAGTKGYRMSYNRLIKRAKEATLHAGEYAFQGRKKRKGQFRGLWIKRINAALANIDGAPKYSRFIKLMANKEVQLNRKILAHLALHNPSIFASIVKKVS